MPPEAKVFIAEDNPLVRAVYESVLEQGGHTVVETATHMTNVRAAMDHMEQTGVHPDVAIVDGNLGVSDEDGARIIGTLRERFPDMKIIGISGEQNGVKGADINLPKGDPSVIEELAGLVTSL